MGYVPKLIDVCSDLGLNLVGVSFHVGSGCGDAGAFVASARDARRVFDMAEEKGFDMRFLDIGGGFPGDKESRPSFPEIATQLAPVLDDLFPPSVSIIAEPGRYFACAAYTLAANIFAKREIAFQEEGEETETQEMQYYLNEGVYQSFNCLFFDHAVVEAKPFFMDPSDEAEAEVKKTCTTIFGPTCDGLDCIAKRIEFPQMKVCEAHSMCLTHTPRTPHSLATGWCSTTSAPTRLPQHRSSTASTRRSSTTSGARAEAQEPLQVDITVRAKPTTQKTTTTKETHPRMTYPFLPSDPCAPTHTPTHPR